MVIFSPKKKQVLPINLPTFFNSTGKSSVSKTGNNPKKRLLYVQTSPLQQEHILHSTLFIRVSSL